MFSVSGFFYGRQIWVIFGGHLRFHYARFSDFLCQLDDQRSINQLLLRVRQLHASAAPQSGKYVTVSEKYMGHVVTYFPDIVTCISLNHHLDLHLVHWSSRSDSLPHRLRSGRMQYSQY